MQPLPFAKSESDAAPVEPDDRDRKKRKQQPRQLQACSKCRERKVKCDKTLPCSACCARGQPKECVFTYSEGSDHAPIAQSHELRRLRTENQRLKERLLGVGASSGDTDEGLSSISFARRRSGIDEPIDTIYFGTPGFASTTIELLNAASGQRTQNLMHSVKPHDILTESGPTMYPFPTIWISGTWIQGLYNCLQPWQEISQLLTSFAAREDSITYPRAAFNISMVEVESFMNDFENNAAAYPDVLALIFAILATESRRQEFGNLVGDDNALREPSSDLRRNLFLSASMQALRHTSFMSQASLSALQAFILICSYLTNDGRVLHAWTNFGTVIRMAQAAGLHRNPQLLDIVPSQRESILRKRLWWHMLYMDEKMCSALGRPLGASSIGDCPLPDPLSTNMAMIRLLSCVDQLTVLGRQILGSAPMNIHRIAHFVEKLQTLLDTIPEEGRFRHVWNSEPSQAPEPPLDGYSAAIHLHVHSYLVLLSHQRIELGKSSGQSSSAEVASDAQETTPSHQADQTQQRTLSSMVESSLQIISVFSYLDARRPLLMVDWSLKQQALIAAVVLISHMQHIRTDQYEGAVRSVLRIFDRHARSFKDFCSRTAYDKLLGKFNEYLSQAGRYMDPQEALHNLGPNTQTSWPLLPGREISRSFSETSASGQGGPETTQPRSGPFHTQPVGLSHMPIANIPDVAFPAVDSRRMSTSYVVPLPQQRHSSSVHPSPQQTPQFTPAQMVQQHGHYSQRSSVSGYDMSPSAIQQQPPMAGYSNINHPYFASFPDGAAMPDDDNDTHE